jgi:hypothetical protein
MTNRWPQQSKTTHTRQANGFLDEYYFDRRRRVLFRWWPGGGEWVRTTVHLSEVSRIERE